MCNRNLIKMSMACHATASRPLHVARRYDNITVIVPAGFRATSLCQRFGVGAHPGSCDPATAAVCRAHRAAVMRMDITIFTIMRSGLMFGYYASKGKHKITGVTASRVRFSFVETNAMNSHKL